MLENNYFGIATVRSSPQAPAHCVFVLSPDTRTNILSPSFNFLIVTVLVSFTALTPGAILGKANSDSGVLEVRKAAVTNTAKGKAASKWTRVELKMPKAVTIEKADVATSSSVKAKVSGGAIELQYTVDKKKSKGKVKLI